MPGLLQRLRHLLVELKRRNVYRVAATYLVVAFAGLEMVDLLIPSTTLPGWAGQLLLAIAILGFPVALVLAWAYDLTPQGVRRTPPPKDVSAVEAGGPEGPEPTEQPETTHSEPSGSSSRVPRVVTGALVGLGAVAGLVVGTWYLLGAGGGAASDPDPSIAVLPFETLGQEVPDAFTEGIHVGVMTRLSNVSGVDVISRTSVKGYAGTSKRLPEIAAELGVGWILRGDVQEAAGQVQVNAQLVDARQDRQVWAQTYQRELTAENVFSIQADLTRTIIEALETRISPGEAQRIEQAPTTDLTAYRLYTQGRMLLDQRTSESMLRSIEYFQRAIRIDSTYALAWAGLADAFSFLEFYNYPTPELELGPRGAARRALDLDPTAGEARASLGILNAVRQQGPEAVRELRRAVELSPSHFEAQAWLGWVYLVLGRPGPAVVHLQRAVTLNPLGPAMLAYAAEAELANGRAAEALEKARRARELQTEYALAHYMEGLVLFHLGRLSEADSILEAALPMVTPEGTPSLSEVQALLAVTRVAQGNTAAARDLLARIRQAGDAFSTGLVLASLDDRDGALGAWESVERWGSFSTEHFRYFFPEILDPLRVTPRFAEIRREVERSWGLVGEAFQGD